MVRMVAVVLIGVCAGWIIWRRWGRGHLPTAPVPSGRLPRETLAFEAFMRGNSCLREGQFAEARGAFHQARELDPKLPYVDARLDEVERQQADGARHADYRTRSPRAIGVGCTDAPELASVNGMPS